MILIVDTHQTALMKFGSLPVSSGATFLLLAATSVVVSSNQLSSDKQKTQQSDNQAVIQNNESQDISQARASSILSPKTSDWSQTEAPTAPQIYVIEGKSSERASDIVTSCYVANSTTSSQVSGGQRNGAARGKIFTNQFVIEVAGGDEEARKLAAKHGFVYLNHILGDFYHLEHQRLSRRSTNELSSSLEMSILDEPQVSSC